MKKQKILKFIIFCGLLFFYGAQCVLAEADLGKFRPEISVDIGGFNSKSFGDPSTTSCPAGVDATTCYKIEWLSQYIVSIYKYIVGIAAILASIMIMIGGFIWLTSAGNPSRITQAKEFIVGALTGLFLALFSYLILFTINPQLVQNNPLVVQGVTPLQNFCCKQDDGSFAYESTQENKCSNGSGAVSIDFCKTQDQLCQEKGGSYIRVGATKDQKTLNDFCSRTCAEMKSTMSKIENDTNYKVPNGLAGCCYCEVKNDIGCCYAPPAPIYYVTGQMGPQWVCLTRNGCFTSGRANVKFKEITGECKVETCKNLTY